MLRSFAIIFLFGLILGEVFKRLKLPSILGMLIAGILVGPFALDLLDEKILNISPDLRQLSLIIILTRAGLALGFDDLRSVGKSAFFMCFVPACFEIAAFLLFAPRLFGLTIAEAGIMGAVIAAVSPAVVVPKMLKLMHEGYGVKEKIPQLVMACASVDDVFVIVVFTSFLSLAMAGNFSPIMFLKVPVSIFIGAIVGSILGNNLPKVLKYVKEDAIKIILLLSISFLLVSFENTFKNIPFSGLLAIMAMGSGIKNSDYELSKTLSKNFTKLWYGAEIWLFVLVGANVNIKYALGLGILSIIMIIIALIFRLAGVLVSLIGSGLEKKEKLFAMVAYTPKATVQAAIGSIALQKGLACGDAVLTMAVVSILFTAPIGALAIDFLYKRLLKKA